MMEARGVDDRPVKARKAGLRKVFQTARDALDPADRAASSAQITTAVPHLPGYRGARLIHCYLSMGSEVDTRPLILNLLAAGRRVAIPLWERGSERTSALEITSLADADFEPAGFGLMVPRIRRPVEIGLIDLVLAPLLAFAPAPTGVWRLGYGAGYYDRFVARLRATAPHTRVIGLAFSIQRTNSLPLEAHDMALDDVVAR